MFQGFRDIKLTRNFHASIFKISNVSCILFAFHACNAYAVSKTLNNELTKKPHVQKDTCGSTISNSCLNFQRVFDVLYDEL